MYRNKNKYNLSINTDNLEESQPYNNPNYEFPDHHPHTPSIAQEKIFSSVPEPQLLQNSKIRQNNVKNFQNFMEIEKELEQQNEIFQNFGGMTDDSTYPNSTSPFGFGKLFSLHDEDKEKKSKGAPFSVFEDINYGGSGAANSSDDDDDDEIYDKYDDDDDHHQFRSSTTTTPATTTTNKKEGDNEELELFECSPTIGKLYKNSHLEKKKKKKKRKKRKKMNELIMERNAKKKIDNSIGDALNNEVRNNLKCFVYLKPARKSSRYYVDFFPCKLFCSPYKYDIFVKLPTSLYESYDIKFNYYDGETKELIEKNHKGKDAIQLGKVKIQKDEDVTEVYSRVCFTVCSFHHFRRPFIVTCSLHSKKDPKDVKVIFTSGEFHTFARKSSQTKLANDVWASDLEDESEKKKSRKRKRSSKSVVNEKKKKRKLEQSNQSSNSTQSSRVFLPIEKLPQL